MQCSVCSIDLIVSERQGIEIDCCPQCGGVWLERGELDMVIRQALAQHDAGHVVNVVQYPGEDEKQSTSTVSP